MILIPAYNEERLIGKFLSSIDFPRENIIVVDDGSSDNTSSVSESKGVNTIRHNINKGKGEAHRTGFDYAMKKGAEWVITMDADGQHSSEDIPLFTRAIDRKNWDIIIGERIISTRTMPFLRFLTNSATSFVVSLLCGKRVRDSQSGFRAVRVRLLSSLSLSTRNFQTESEIIIKAGRKGFKIGAVPIKTIYNDSKSYIRPFLDSVRFIILVIQSLWI